MHTYRRYQIAMAFFWLVFGCTTAAGAGMEHAAIVRSASGDCTIIRDGKTLAAEVGTTVFSGDLVKTEATGKIGLIFDDDTVLSMGPGSQILIRDFLFQPAEHKMSFVARLVQGTLSLVTGQLAKLVPDQVRLETPDATIGFRGTHVLVSVN